MLPDDDARWWPTLLAIALLVGCACASTAAQPRETETCDALLARYRATLSSASSACASDADCAIYGGVDPDAVCGGSTDADTARQLAAISARRDAAGCPRPGYSCPPITPRCVDHVCR